MIPLSAIQLGSFLCCEDDLYSKNRKRAGQAMEQPVVSATGEEPSQCMTGIVDPNIAH
jgi:hypothetical protein